MHTDRSERPEKRAHWHVSATAPTLQRTEIIEREIIEREIIEREIVERNGARFDVGPPVRLPSQITGQRGPIKTNGAGGAGLTIARSGVRLPMGCRLVDGDRDAPETGSMDDG